MLPACISKRNKGRGSSSALMLGRYVQASPYTAGGKTVSWDEPCDFFHEGKAKASTLSLSVLVAIEMFNALNALSEVGCLTITKRPTSNGF